MNPQIYMLSEEGIKVLAEQITENIRSSFKNKFSSDEDEFLSIDETAKLINLKKSTIYGLVHKNDIPHFKNGKKLRFQKREILDWIKDGKRKTKSDIQKQADTYLANNNLI